MPLAKKRFSLKEKSNVAMTKARYVQLYDHHMDSIALERHFDLHWHSFYKTWDMSQPRLTQMLRYEKQ